MHKLNIGNIAERVKTLSDSNLCICCDKLNTPCLRYPCGHSACETCVSVAECCLLCVTPPAKIINLKDEHLSIRVQHVSDLVSAFQDLFGLDVHKISSVSKQLKLEKELFPECIQAPNKYYNKRKSSNSLSTVKGNKKSKLVLPGEEVNNTTYSEMENRNNYVEKWVNSSKNMLSLKKRPRKPFSDISINQNEQYEITKDAQVKDKRKRKHAEALPNNVESNNLPQERNKENHFNESKWVKCHESTNKRIKHEQNKNINESGVFIDDDVDEIMGSEEEVADKDQLACLAIAEAEPNVPFYKMGLLHTFCNKTDVGTNDKCENNKNLKTVTKTIENESYLITVSISNCENITSGSTSIGNVSSNAHYALHGKTPQSTKKDNEEKIPINVMTETSPNVSHLSEYMKHANEESGYNSKTYIEESISNSKESIVISNSDTDSSLGDRDEQDTKTVNCIGHTSSGASRGVLSHLQLHDFLNRPKPARRRATPRSSDSSDKENYDPNRGKRRQLRKKMKCIQILKKKYF